MRKRAIYWRLLAESCAIYSSLVFAFLAMTSVCAKLYCASAKGETGTGSDCSLTVGVRK
ncbi:hypothetical protein [Arsenophonus endosymbiont of Aleurodicus dispersus]|uniref:hypothetical protein n=1 Tax=Arsenophonus endosymbiont of Aleurodicus dispersus TaxID=235559 RepID=UPI00155997EF